jgi:small subunit ribosomal protein S17
MEKRINRRKILTGSVISDKMMKTRVVEVKSHAKHPKYSKLITNFVRYKAHDEKNESKTGDVVSMSLTRPLSKDKRWVITEIVKKVVTEEAVVL